MKLCVNVDHVATIREARKITEPDPVEAALIALKYGAYGITIHLREDRRHIQDNDLRKMRKAVHAKLNLEMAATGEMIDIALDVSPDQITLVPEKRQEITTEGGLDAAAQESHIKTAVEAFRKKNIPVSLFIDPEPVQIEASARIGVDSIEINTAAYSECKTIDDEKTESLKIETGVLSARKNGLKVYAGHGLNYKNTRRIAMIPAIEELNIGHSIIARSIFVGMERAVLEMLKLLN